MVKKIKDVDAYIAAASKQAQGMLKQLRRIIRSEAPLAEERISYQMPYYHYFGRLFYFAAFKNHVSLFVINGNAMKAYKKQLHGYQITKATVHFPFERPIPKALVKRLVRASYQENKIRATIKAKKARL